ncbi:MAG TPA: prolyl oligopeptidase family serine peptidase [Candidatus Elarobacter sp.]|jgi:dipeptidyl aminopeptidase/acylaminoacyl peptidase|nr:prolyl oligopeptidase family serine peptidase [Candidatus Elarobacter sp.]
MIGARAFVALGLVCSLLPASARSVAADAPAPLDYKAYDGWNAIRTPKISDDGKHFAYALTPEDGDPMLVVRDLDSGAERRETRGNAEAFAGEGRFVVYTHVAPKKDVDAAKKAKKPESQQPKNGLGILDLSSAKPAEIVDDVKTIAVAKNGGATIAYRAEPSPAPSGSPAPAAASASPVASAKPSAPPKGEPAPQLPSQTTPAPGASGSPAPSPSPSGSPAPKADKTKETGTALTVRDLASGKRVTAPDATDFAVSDDDRFVAYATESKNGKNDGFHLYDVARGTTTDVLTGEGRYRDVAIARDGSSVAFLSDVATYKNDVPHDAAYVVDLRAAKPAAVKVVDEGTAGLPAATAPNASGKLRFSHDGKRLFIGTAAAPTPMPSGTPAPTAVDLWSYRDDVLQSQQKHDADKERKRTYLAAYDLATSRFAQLGSPTLRDVTTVDEGDVALGQDDRPYRRASSWTGEDYVDAYAVALEDGRRTLLRRKMASADLSPGGKYVLEWDEATRHWFAIRTSDGRRVELGARAGVAFHDVDDDHPAPPSPYGFGGWLAGDRGVMIYDEYDVWLANPDTGAATNLTRGEGRKTRTVYSPVSTDPEATAFAADKPILLTLIDTRDYSSGYARVAPGGGDPRTLFKANEIVYGLRNVFNAPLHNLAAAPIAAKHADRYLFTRESFRNYRNFWATDSSFAHLAKVTDANPQQTKYRWGTERLIDYTSADGKKMRAVMLVPDGLRADRKAPMLVYFYETWSSMFHWYYTPAPGTSPNMTRYVSNGYVVLLPDVHYRIGHPGRSALDCILPAVDAALKTNYADPARVGVAGHSWAAYQINYMITKTHRFRAAEAGAAVDDMISAYGGIRLESGIVRESQYEHTQSRIGATPWDRPDLYLENSGLFGIKNITTPYLTIHNDQDGAVPQFQGIEFITAMRRLGKEAYLFSFDGEDHNLRGREQQKYWTVHLDEWFDHWLKGAPRPAWMNGVDYLHRGERNVHPLYGEPD